MIFFPLLKCGLCDETALNIRAQVRPYTTLYRQAHAYECLRDGCHRIFQLREVLAPLLRPTPSFLCPF
eukprot:g24320.t1